MDGNKEGRIRDVDGWEHHPFCSVPSTWDHMMRPYSLFLALNYYYYYYLKKRCYMEIVIGLIGYDLGSSA